MAIICCFVIIWLVLENQPNSKHSYVVLSEMSLAETRQQREPQGSRIKTQEPIHSGRIMLILPQELEELVRRRSKKSPEKQWCCVFLWVLWLSTAIKPSCLHSSFIPLANNRNHKYKHEWPYTLEKYMGGRPSPQVTYKLPALKKGV